MKREDMKAAAKFLVRCATCGERKAYSVTAYTAAAWMHRHEQQHRTHFGAKADEATP